MPPFEDFVNTELPLRVNIPALPVATRYPRFTGIGRAVEERTATQVRTDIGAGVGDVVSTGASVDNAVPRSIGTTGDSIEFTAVVIDDGGSLWLAVGQGVTWPDTSGFYVARIAGDILDINGSAVAAGMIDLTPGASGLVRPTRLAPQGTGGTGHVLKQVSAGGVISSGTVDTANLTNDAVTLAKLQNAVASSKLLGSGATGASADYVEIVLGTNLSMSGTTLNATGGGGSVTFLSMAKWGVD